MQHSAAVFLPQPPARSTTLVSRDGGMGSYFGVGVNQISTSFLGLRGRKEIGDNLFPCSTCRPFSTRSRGMNADGTATIAQNNGLPFNNLADFFGNSWRPARCSTTPPTSA